MKFLLSDATNMKKFRDGQFSVVLDKGTLDAILVDTSEATMTLTEKYWSEIDRVLRIGGRYVIISLLQEHIIKALLQRFPPNNWMFRVVRCVDVEHRSAEDQTNSVQMPVFMVVATKMKMLPMHVLEICTVGDKNVRVKHPDEILNEVSVLQKAAVAMNGLKRTNISGEIKNEVVKIMLLWGFFFRFSNILLLPS